VFKTKKSAFCDDHWLGVHPIIYRFDRCPTNKRRRLHTETEANEAEASEDQKAEDVKQSEGDERLGLAVWCEHQARPVFEEVPLLHLSVGIEHCSSSVSLTKPKPTFVDAAVDVLHRPFTFKEVNIKRKQVKRERAGEEAKR